MIRFLLKVKKEGTDRIDLAPGDEIVVRRGDLEIAFNLADILEFQIDGADVSLLQGQRLGVATKAMRIVCHDTALPVVFIAPADAMTELGEHLAEKTIERVAVLPADLKLPS